MLRQRSLVGLMVGGKYRLRRVLGHGGMGTVYKAENVAIRRTVALKLLHHHLADDDVSVARFQREARSAASVAHENIIDVLDMGVEPKGAPYTVMEYVRGRSVAAALSQDGPFPVERAAKIAGQVLAGLAAAHEEGIIHRDLKPENVMLTTLRNRRDFVKLFDFGVAAFLDAAHLSGPNDLTPSGKSMGTPSHASPEQIMGRRVRDARVDIYSVGVLLFEMLTGRVPFEGASFPELCRAITDDPPPTFFSFDVEVDPRLEAVVHRALAKDPEERWQSATQLWEALVPWGAEAPTAAAATTDTLTMELRLLRARELEMNGGDDRSSLEGERPMVMGRALLEILDFLEERFGAVQLADWLEKEPALAEIASADLDPDAWYASPRPILVLEAIDRDIGRGDRRLVADAGRYLARRATRRSDEPLQGKALTPELLFSMVPELWRSYLQAGEVRVAKVGRGYGRLELRHPAPSLAFNAALAGYLDEALRIAGARAVDVQVEASAALGDEQDVFEATWSS